MTVCPITQNACKKECAWYDTFNDCCAVISIKKELAEVHAIIEDAAIHAEP